MTMRNPPHPGEFIKETYLMPFSLSERAVAKNLDISPSTFNRLIKGDYSVSPEMAYRLSIVLGRSPESWLEMQAQYDLCHVKYKNKLNKLKPIDFDHLADAA